MITLRNANSALQISPRGAAIWRCLVDGEDLFRSPNESAAPGDDPLAPGVFPCLPWFGRLPNGIDIDGDQSPLAPTVRTRNLEAAIHGHGWTSDWRVIDQSSDDARLALNFAPSAGRFPFALSATLSFKLIESGVEARATLTNTGAAEMPFGLGFHPFFERRSATRLKLKATQLWTPPLATQRAKTGPIPDALDFSAPRELPRAEIDHSFIGFDGEAQIIDGAQTIVVKSDALFAHLFAPKGRPYFCIEPITQLPGRFGESILAPGESASLQMSVERG